VVVCTDARRNGLIMLFDRPAMLFLICVIFHAYSSSFLFSGESFWDVEGGKPELEKHSPIPPARSYVCPLRPGEVTLWTKSPTQGDTETEGMFISNLVAAAISDSELL